MSIIIRCFCYIIIFFYVILFIPAFTLIAPLGAFVQDREGVGTVAMFSCLIATTLIPLAMPASSWRRVSSKSGAQARGKYDANVFELEPWKGVE